jgi:hypothetical protein
MLRRIRSKEWSTHDRAPITRARSHLELALGNLGGDGSYLRPDASACHCLPPPTRTVVGCWVSGPAGRAAPSTRARNLAPPAAEYHGDGVPELTGLLLVYPYIHGLHLQPLTLRAHFSMAYMPVDTRSHATLY